MESREAIHRAREVIQAIREDRVSGARELTRQALEAVEWLAKAMVDEEVGVRRQSAACMTRLQKAQPVMAPLIRLADEARAELDKESPAERLAALAAVWRERQRVAPERMAELLAGRLKRHRRVMTYSRSSTLMEVLRVRRDWDLRIRWVLSEGTPAMEGVLAAQELREMGYSVTLTTDSELAGQLGDVDSMLVGADAVLSGRALINKRGTCVLAREAARLGIPVLVACETLKVLPRRLQPLLKLPGRSSLFDATPWRYLSEILTEEGPLRS